MILGALIAFAIWFALLAITITAARVQGYNVSLTPINFVYAAGWATIGALIGHFLG